MKASHFAPTLLVTILAFFLANQTFNFVESLFVAITIFTGQLLVGWTNDLLDYESDRLQNRREKPLVNGELSANSLKRAIWFDVPLCVAFSLLGPLGLRGGLVHLLGVGCGVSYNFYFKKRISSVLPYTCAFAALPSAPYIAKGITPPMWMVIAGAGFGTVAHFANVLQDLDADRALGIYGLPQRIGVNKSIAVSVLVLLIITPVIAAHRPHFAFLAFLALFAALAALLVRPKKFGFSAIMALALIDVLLTALA